MQDRKFQQKLPVFLFLACRSGTDAPARGLPAWKTASYVAMPNPELFLPFASNCGPPLFAALRAD